MSLRLWGTTVLVGLLILTTAACGPTRAQYGVSGSRPGYPFAGSYVAAYGSNPFTGFGSYSASFPSGHGYGVGTGQVGAGYQSAGGLYQQAYQAARPQTTVALQPVYDVITSVPGWSGPRPRARRRVRTSRPSVPLTPPFDDNGKILWPSSIPNDPAAAESRRTAELAVRAVVHESKSTGHASVKPVIAAKNKLSAFERTVLPAVKNKNATDGAALETFFLDLDKALDALSYVY
jgi:hypothetical protein